MTPKNFFIVTAAFEFLTAIALLIAPAFTASQLLGSSLETPVGAAVGRVAGAALFTLAIACWSARNDAQSRAANGLIRAMLFYNVAVILLLAYGAITSSLMGVGFVPAIVAHAAFTVWCIALLFRTPITNQNRTS